MGGLPRAQIAAAADRRSFPTRDHAHYARLMDIDRSERKERSDPILTEIRQEGADGLAIRWADGSGAVLAVRELRLACACAECVDEWTGRPRLDPSSVPDDVRPKRIAPVGRYAIRIDWSDGHDSGIYTFTRLRSLTGSQALPDDAGSEATEDPTR